MGEPKFKPKNGQVDYSNVRFAPVLNCVLKFKDKFLLVLRSSDLKLYPDCWNGISGFLDDGQDLEEKVEEELREETGLLKENILSIKRGDIFEVEAPEYKKVWIVHPVLVEVNTDKIKLDWEAKNFKWLAKDELKGLHFLSGFDKVLQNLKIISK